MLMDRVWVDKVGIFCPRRCKLVHLTRVHMPQEWQGSKVMLLQHEFTDTMLNCKTDNTWTNWLKEDRDSNPDQDSERRLPSQEERECLKEAGRCPTV
jgi:hypothetical protein